MMNQSELLALLGEGKEAWNEWVNANPAAEVDFTGVEFDNTVTFKGFQFPNNATFTGATFSGDADFSNATFSGVANFTGAKFSHGADFGKATFSGNAHFSEATFSGNAHFSETTFSGDATFSETTFSGVAFFGEMTFSGFAFFAKATFSGSAYFRKATFSGSADFSRATLSDGANIIEATFSGDAMFIEATFSRGANFTGAKFSHGAFFGRATFSGDADFSRATFSGNATFSETTFSGDATFSKTTFSDVAFFGETTFSGVAFFGKATFSGDSVFVSINVESMIDFGDTEFHRIPDFHAAKNPERIALDTVEFALPKPTGRFYRFVYWSTGLRGSDQSTMIKIRRIRGIANKNHAIDAERDLTILERNAKTGAAWAELMKRRSITKKNDAICAEPDLTPLDRNAQIGAIPELWNELEPLRQWFAKLFTTVLETLLLLAYRWFSKYGRSVVWPAFWLVVSFCSYRWLYGYRYDKVHSDYPEAKNVSDSLLDFTITSMVPFGSNVRPTYQIAVNNLFPTIEQTLPNGQILLQGRVPAMFQFVSLSQGVMTLIFVFLIGLALRNFFRMK